MKYQKLILVMAVILLSLPLTSCNRNQDNYTDLDVAVAVALTLTSSAAEAQQSIPEPTTTPEPTPTSKALQPLSQDECNSLATSLGQSLGVEGEQGQAAIEDIVNELGGTGCQSQFVVNNADIDHYGTFLFAVLSAIETQGWEEDFAYAASGPGAELRGFRKARGVCRVWIHLSPVEDELCSEYATAGACCPNLEPEQCQSTVTLVCAQGNLPEVEVTLPSDDEPTRIEFAEGGFSSKISGTISPNSIDHFVLRAEANQQLNTVVFPPGVVNVSVIGEDGTVLKSDLNNESDWTGVLPTSQDYFINVRSMIDSDTEYSLDISIQPLTPIATTGEIAGGIGYTGEYIPPMHIVAYNQETNLWYFLKTGENTPYYTMPGLPPGTYKVTAYTQTDLIGGYVSSGAELLLVTVNAGETTDGIDLINWYQPGSVSFPSDPVGW
ncbi:MAG: carboxypeptidase regulatory-like domain-containing protein [Anaerolineales bacterium]|nr:carboxypeptidase regulatory-like domain-containing protein [Anaerolineales bacterium]